jgi:Xaa-Pro aminopeptidase
VALPKSQIPEEHRRIWHYVRSAQTVASHTAHEGVLTNKVDEAPRTFLEKAGYASYFTHRLGHGTSFHADILRTSFNWI